jgi:hypothetical protein
MSKSVHVSRVKDMRVGRPIKPRTIRYSPNYCRFVPVQEVQKVSKNVIVMGVDEFEALRLVDYEGLLQEEAARLMNVSRGTVWRCLNSARRKVVSMLIEGKELVIKGINGKFEVKRN